MTHLPYESELEFKEKLGLAIYWESRPESWSSDMRKTIDDVYDLFTSYASTQRQEGYKDGYERGITALQEEISKSSMRLKANIPSLQSQHGEKKGDL